VGLEDAVTPTRAGTRIAVEVHAGAKQTVVPAGYDPWRKTIAARLISHPLKGAANRELLTELGKVLDMPSCDIFIVHGATGSRKVIEVRGADVDYVRGRLRAALGK